MDYIIKKLEEKDLTTLVELCQKINKEKVLHLVETGMMTEAGFKIIETAKQNGQWTILDEVEKLIIPEDLEAALKNKLAAMDFFLGLSQSARKAMLQWLTLARRQETRQKRITEILELAEKKLKFKQFILKTETSNNQV